MAAKREMGVNGCENGSSAPAFRLSGSSQRFPIQQSSHVPLTPPFRIRSFKSVLARMQRLGLGRFERLYLVRPTRIAVRQRPVEIRRGGFRLGFSGKP
jgi:hypothetical protein